MKLFFCSIALFFVSTLPAQTINITPFLSGLNQPLAIETTGIPGDNRIFVVQQNGLIRIFYPDGTEAPAPFLDISSQISTGGEQGLLSLAFQPGFGSTRFYVNYTDLNGNTQVSRFLADGFNPNLAIPSSELLIIAYSQPFSNHNGGNLAFGPNGYLHIASGDGGGGGDPGNRAQDLGVLLGKILRIDVDNPSGGKIMASHQTTRL